MREILFRGKDLQEQNGWLYGDFYISDINKRERESGKATLIFTPDCDTFIYVPEYHNSWMVKAETVGQYTGLTDKNGTKIFEGDIVSGHLDELFPEQESRYPVVWHDYGWHIKCGNRSFDTLEQCWVSEYLEVIGNIYDNPELLDR